MAKRKGVQGDELRQIVAETMNRRVEKKTRNKYDGHMDDFFNWLENEADLQLKEESYNEDGNLKLPLNVSNLSFKYILIILYRLK
jgi:histone acetyltransferase (RNA polymerase elongator complex component)